MTRRIIDKAHQALRDKQAQFCRISFLRKNQEGHIIHCGEDDDWTECRVSPVSSYSSYGEQTFAPDQTYQRDTLLALLAQAFELGRLAKAREIKSVLEIK
ncbi:hypothetical protein ABID21_000697 [Pseudorhizobium tarimense]|uniref:Uncharacterized protein n=2 Tax=Pseudorhizobium tarimense TaxID=1079109 RepID=A0ABV2H2U0_9HYPH|nr:hypothetical protein [Pseudorhizobium tarimense]